MRASDAAQMHSNRVASNRRLSQARWRAGLAAIAMVAVMGASEAASAQQLDDNLGDIIVTARRVEERLQDVPISITVLTPQEIENRNIYAATDLATYTPSLSTNQRYGPDKATFSIRGFNQEASTAPTVGVYFADVVGVRAQGGTPAGNTVGPGSFMDLQNVQVLKGPQGTLFGRNTTGGAILLVPTKPTSETGAYLEAAIGDYGAIRATAVANIPLSDTVRVRLGFERNKRDGYLKNTGPTGPRDFNNLDYTYFRGSLVADLTPDIENYTIFHYSNSSTHGFAGKVVACDTNSTNGANAAPTTANFTRVLLARAACDLIARQQARGDGPYDVSVNASPVANQRQIQFQLINTTRWVASETLTIKNIASYGEFHEKADLSFFSDDFTIPTNFVVPGGLNFSVVGGQRFTVIRLANSPGSESAASRTFSDELQVQGTSFDGSLNWVVGGYLEFSRPISWQQTTTAQFMNCSPPADPREMNCGNPLAFVGSYVQARTKNSFDNHGIFAQGTFKLSDSFSVTAGARYTFDKIKAIGESTRYNFNGATFFQNCNDTTRFYVKDASGNPVLVRGARVSLPVTNASQCHNEINNNSSKPTWLIEADYKPDENVMLYAKYARGYRQGGISLTNIGQETWGPEKLDAYEIGAKTSFDGAIRGSFNIAAFYNKLFGQQIFGSFTSKDVSVVAGGPGIINAGSSVIKGIEIDTMLAPLKGLRFDLGYAYIDSEITDLTVPTLPADSPFSVFNPRAARGDPLSFTPKHRVSLTGSYTLPLAEDIGDLTFAMTYTYTSEQLSDRATPVYGVYPASNLLNLNINWDSVLGSPVDASFFITNLTNERYAVSGPNSWGSFGYADIAYGAPRMIGAKLRVTFGAK